MNDIFGVFEVFFTLRKFGCDNNSRHHIPQRVCQSLWRLDMLDSLAFHSAALGAAGIPENSRTDFSGTPADADGSLYDAMTRPINWFDSRSWN